MRQGDLRDAPNWTRLSPTFRKHIERRVGTFEQTMAKSITLDRLLAGNSEGVPMSDEPTKPEVKTVAPNAAFKSLPGLLTSVTRSLNDDAGELARRLHAIAGDSAVHMPKARAHVEVLEKTVQQVKDFNDEMANALGDNGAPPEEEGKTS